MSKYFNNCKNLDELRREYLKLIKQHHPDLTKDESELEERNKICAEINGEYELMARMFPAASTKNPESDSLYEKLINGSDDARQAVHEILDRISKLALDYNFYHVHENAPWWEEQTLAEINNTISLFWQICLLKNITGNEFARLFELCDSNVEKMRRVIMLLSTGAISEKDIHTNLTSSNSIPFFNDNITIENLPNYNSFLLLSKETTKQETYEAWIEFCQNQRDNFYERYYDTVVPKIPSGKQM